MAKKAHYLRMRKTAMRKQRLARNSTIPAPPQVIPAPQDQLAPSGRPEVKNERIAGQFLAPGNTINRVSGPSTTLW